MVKYEFKAKDESGKTKMGIVMAENLNDFYAKLKQQKLLCISVEETHKEIPQMGDKSGHIGKLKLQDISIFCRQFATMLNSGLTVVKALDILYRQAEKRLVKDVMLDLYESIKKGNSLSSSLKNMGKVFPSLLISMVESGEASGTLDDVMLTMSSHYEKEKILQGKVKSAMIYPIVLIVVCIAVVILLLTFVMPTFFELFDNKADLPGTTKALLGMSQFLVNYWYVALMLVAAIVVGFFFLFKVDSVRLSLDKIKVKMPVIGKLQTTIITARFARTIASLYAGGVPIIDCIKIAANVMGNLYISERLSFVIDEIKRGISFSQALITADCFPQMFSSMVFIGEESGSLDEILEKTANFYDEDASAAISKMVALMEPCMIVIMGLVVGGIVVSIATPMFTMYDQI